MIDTFSGGVFHFDEPNVDINDIAHSLSLLCRFGGHCKRFYSVAEHSLNVSYRCKNKLWGLLHDAAEAYIGDIVSPLKKRLPLIREMETLILKLIAEKYNLCWPIPDEVMEVDRRMFVTEQRDLMIDATSRSDVQPFPRRIERMLDVEYRFIYCFNFLRTR